MKLTVNLTSRTSNYQRISMKRTLLPVCLCAMALVFSACGDKSSGMPPLHNEPSAASAPEAAKEGERIIQ